MKLDLDSLNANQRAAVDWDKGPLLVLAGPGSGKTRVLTMRVAKLLMDSPDQRFRILGLTFTNKAAAEMRTRVDEMVYERRERALLTTFHSLCADILRQHGSHINIQPDFVILNQDSDREGVLIDAINALKKDVSDVGEADVRLLPLIDKLLENCIDENAVESSIHNKELGHKLGLLYTEYRHQLSVNNRLDFPSLLYCTVELLTKVPAIAKQLQTVYKHVCVDEFQDTNLAQYRVLRLVVEENPKNLFVVADDDQIIYQWNGASPERLRELRQDFKMQVIQLPANYRCPPDVIALANNLIKHNLDRSSDKEPLYAIKTTRGDKAVRVEAFESFDDEVAWVAADILKRPSTDRGGCVVLGRTKKLLDVAVKAFESAGLKASLAVRKNEFESVPLRWLHAMLRLANARGDREQLRRVCKLFYQIEGVNIEVQDVIAYASVLGGDYLRSWVERVLERQEIEANTRKCLISAHEQIVERLDFFSFIREAFKWLEDLQRRVTGESEDIFADFKDEKATWEELQKQVSGKYGDDQVTLQILLQEFDLSPKTPPVPKDAVRCLTIHGSKGLEFDHVYLIGLVEDQLPSYQSVKKGDGSREMQEERRNCFVAITRTQSTLTLTYASKYFGWGKRPSRFLCEMGLV